MPGRLARDREAETAVFLTWNPVNDGVMRASVNGAFGLRHAVQWDFGCAESQEPYCQLPV